MSRGLSIYLDLLRFSAAVMVFLFHAAHPDFGGQWLAPVFGHSGSYGVVIFFVMSGFVIAYVTEIKERDPQTYILHRLARLWSVALPALLLTIIADSIGRHYDVAAYPEWYPTSVVLSCARLLLAATFTNQVWNISSIPLSNTPFWSLSYEFFYYMAFGAFVLLSGWRFVFTALCIAAMGPKILLLFPVWLTGVAAFRLSARFKATKVLGVAMIFAPLLIRTPLLDGVQEQIYNLATLFVPADRMIFSGIVGIGTVFGMLTAINILGVAALSPLVETILRPIERPIRFMAGATLSLYLFHYPLMIMFDAIFSLSTTLANILMSSATFLICLILSRYTEAKKNIFRTVIQRVSELWSVAVQKA